LSSPSGAGPGRAHRHPGLVLGYVVEGQLRFGINNESEKVVPAGGTFFEPLGAIHTTSGSARPDAPVRFLAFMVVPKGSPLTAPA
jgi:quercetin dioxygenase-like cupin family protein